jgi:hypothetical protein
MLFLIKLLTIDLCEVETEEKGLLKAPEEKIPGPPLLFN